MYGERVWSEQECGEESNRRLTGFEHGRDKGGSRMTVDGQQRPPCMALQPPSTRPHARASEPTRSTRIQSDLGHVIYLNDV